VRLKADTSQLNLPHGNKNQKRGKSKKAKVKLDMLRGIGKQSVNVVRYRRSLIFRDFLFSVQDGKLASYFAVSSLSEMLKEE